MNTVLSLLSTDSFIVVNKAVIKKLGLHEAILLGELCSEYSYWESQGKLEDGMFYSTRDNIEENTGLTDYFQREAMKNLQDQGILKIVKQGMPAKNYYKIDEIQLLTLLRTSDKEHEGQVIKAIEVNNNKPIVISKNKTNSKELVEEHGSSDNFSFGSKKSKKNNLYTRCIAMIDNYTMDPTLRMVLIDYLRVRLEMKDVPLYSNSWKGLLNKLDRDFDASERLAVIRQSIEKGYKSFFPVNSYKRNNNDIKFSEDGVISEAYTKEELKELAELEAERERNGLRTKF